MKIENPLFLLLLGDFYLHTKVLTNYNIYINNQISSLIEAQINNQTNYILSDFLNIRNKNEVKLAYFNLDKENNILFRDIFGKEVKVKAFISPYDNKIYTNTNVLIQQATTYRHSTGILYIIEDTDNLLLIDQSLKNLTISDTTKSIIQKLLFFAPENYNTLEKLISILLGSPVSLAYEGETILNVTNESIITDKNIYTKESICFVPKVGTKINFLEPIYYKCKIAPELFQKDKVYLKLLKYTSLNKSYYQKLIEAIHANFLYIKIPLEVFIENTNTIKNLNFIKNKFKIINLTPITTFEESNEINSRLKENLFYKDEIELVAVESFSIETHFYEFSVLSYTQEKPLLKLKDKNNINQIQKEILTSKLDERETVSHLENEKTLYESFSNIDSIEENKKSSILNNFQIFNTKEQTTRNILIIDNTFIQNDKITYKIISESITKINEPEIITFTTSKIDLMFKQTDYNRIKYKAIDNLSTNELRFFNSKLKREEKGPKQKDKGHNILSKNDSIMSENKLKIAEIDKSNIKIYNKDTLKTTYSSINSQIIIENKRLIEIRKEILEIRDEMDINSDTTIDKE